MEIGGSLAGIQGRARHWAVAASRPGQPPCSFVGASAASWGRRFLNDEAPAHLCDGGFGSSGLLSSQGGLSPALVCSLVLGCGGRI